MNPMAFWSLLKQAGKSWMEDKASRLGAALAYYTTFALAPLLLICVAVAGLVFGKKAAQGYLVDELRGLLGDQGGEAVQAMLAASDKPTVGILATVVGVVMLLFGAMGLFVELQDALNTIWEVHPKPGRGIWRFVKERILSFSMVLGVAFLLLVSLVVSTVLSAMASHFGDCQTNVLCEGGHFAISIVVITLLFAMMYKFLPDAVVAWRDVWLGAVVASVLFSTGKLAIGIYLGRSATASSFGAAGSLAVLLIWFYYSSQIFLFGAEVTKVSSERRLGKTVPAPNAVAVSEAQRQQEGIPRKS